MKKINIAIDGPASSGKSTIAKLLAKKYGYLYIDTGAMYRSLTYFALRGKVSVDNEESLLSLLGNMNIIFKKSEHEQLIFVNETDVTEAIRSAEVTNKVSVVSAHKKVRQNLVKLQKEYAKNKGVIMDGRDIGTVVLADAEIKIFLVASIDERVRRRFAENKSKGIETDFDSLKRSIMQRDYLDSHRENSPLIRADQAHLVDTTGLDIEQVLEKIDTLVKKTV